MPLLRRRLLLLTLTVALAGCTAGGARGPAADQPRTTVRVDNRRFLDMNIYVLSGSQRIRLGTVTGLSSRVFTIPANLVFGISTLRFLADPIGSSVTPVSHEISVSPGEQVELQLLP